MSDWNRKPLQKPSAEKNRELDDFWNVESLLPDRPTRRVPPQPGRTPEAVDIELTPNPQTSPEGTAPRPVGSVPLTWTSPAEHRKEEAATKGNSRAMPESRPDSASTLPPHSRPSPIPARSITTEPVRFVPPRQKEEPTDEPLADYTPTGVLLHRVRVYAWRSNYHYFDGFVEDALRFHGMKAPQNARKEAFFSYFPQYTQLNRRAAAWYLYWREAVRNGRYPDTDYAYVLLYLFELINLPVSASSEAEDRRDTMAQVWTAYRRSFPQLDHYMCEWLCDYCLIHGLTAPVDLLADALDDVIMGSRLKEFYLSAAVRLPEAGGKDTADTALQTARILMRHCCQYDYRKSKFANGEHKELFDSTIPAAVAHVLPLLLGANGQKPAITMLDSTVTRDAYTGALCSYRNKRKIEVSYTSFSRSHELRFLIGDMVKHVENRLRGWIGVRSKLSVMSLPLPLRDALDAYLNPMEPPKSAVPVKKREEPRPAYEALYDLPRKEVSLEDAAAIEADSWETTRILVEAFEVADGAANDVAQGANDVAQGANDVPLRGNDVAVDTANDVPLRGNDVAPTAQTEGNAENAVNGEPTMTAESGEDRPLAPYAPFIKAALDGDSAALRAAAKTLGKMPDALADEINALTADGEIGDIILEDDGMGGYAVIEDYRDAVAAMIQE